jgi:hypothetical protein
MRSRFTLFMIERLLGVLLTILFVKSQLLESNLFSCFLVEEDFVFCLVCFRCTH